MELQNLKLDLIQLNSSTKSLEESHGADSGLMNIIKKKIKNWSILQENSSREIRRELSNAAATSVCPWN